MMSLDERIMKIVELLVSYGRPVTSQEIANIIGISSRTVRETIHQNKSHLKLIGIEIKSHFKSGYSISIEDEYRNNWKTLLDENRSIIPSETEDKMTYIIQRFILEEGYIKLDDLCDELWISRSTMNRLFKEVRKRFALYHLTVISKPSYGLKLEGNEIDKRICLVHNCIQKRESSLERFMEEYHIDLQNCQCIRQVVLKHLKKYNYKLTDTGFQNLIIHLIVAIKRIEEKQLITTYPIQVDNVGIEYLLANDIVEELQSYFSITFPKEEVEYVIIHLYGKKLTQMDGETAQISHEMEQMIQKINQQILMKLGYHFDGDFELFTLLALHMMPLVVRIQYGLNMPNPIIKDIKLKMADAYECAVIASQVIQDEYHKPIAEGELGYLALHYSMAIERLQEQTKMKNIVIICSSGMGTSSILKKRLMKKFDIDDSHIQVYDAQSIRSVNLSHIDYIISTVKLNLKLDKPIIYMENIFDDIELQESQHMRNLQSFIKKDLVLLQQTFQTKEDILNDMCHKIENIYSLPFSFQKFIEEREDLSSTEVGNLVAMPHPSSLCTEQSIVMIMTLKKSILWKNNYVKYIFLVSGNKNSKEECEFINENIIDLIMNNQWLQELDKISSYEELIHIL